MKKIIALIIAVIVLNNTCFAAVGHDTEGNENPESPVNISENGQFIEIDVDATEGSSGIRYTTLGYWVNIWTPNRPYTIFVEVNDGGQTGEEVIHQIPILSTGNGDSIQELAGIDNLEIDIATGTVDMEFNARIGIINNGELVEGEYYEDIDSLTAAYGWSQVALDAFPTRFDRILNLDPNLMNITYDPNSLVNSGNEGNEGTTGGGNAIGVTITSAQPAYATIGADIYGSEAYSVTDGIPSSESCYIDIGCDQYKMEYIIGQYSGNYNARVTVAADVTYIYQVRRYNSTTMSYEQDADGNYIYDTVSQTNRLTQTFNYSEPFEFYTVEQLGVYGLTSATVSNGAIGNMSLSPSANYSSPVVNMNVYADFEDHFSYTDSVYAGNLTVYGNTSTYVDLSSYAPSNLNLRVRNDGLVLNGTTLMNDSFTSGSVPTPVTSITIPFVDSAIFAENLGIPYNTLNDVYPSTTTLNYTQVAAYNSAGSVTESVATNEVVVHTPVVAYPEVRDMLGINQEVDYAVGYPTVVIDQPFLLNYPNDGSHLGILGYGNRDYTPFIASKEVTFDFDVYYGDNRNTGTYYPADTPISLPVGDDQYEFFVPHWVDDMTGTVQFRTEAINNPETPGLEEDNANLTISNYVAVESTQVEVVGQVYDFTIHGTTDAMWDTFFFDENDIHTGNVFNAGEANKYGELYNPDYILPMMPGKNDETGYQNVAIKKGAGVFFSVKTVGNMDSNQDFVVVTPTYGFIDSTGTRQDVDVYVTEGGRVIPISESTTAVNGGMNNAYTHIDMTDLRNTAIAYYLINGESEDRDDYIDRFIWDTSKDVNKMGSYSMLALDYEQRIFIGETTNLPTGVSDIDAKTGIQEFYGVYVLPSTAFAVPAGTSQGDVISNILEDGYIVVNFNISTIDEYDGNGYDPGTDDYLSYDEAQANMWSVEAYDATQGDLVLGDAIYYYCDKTASEDYDASGTH